MDSSVRFANAQYYDDDAGLIWFTAFTRREVVPCAIELKAMLECFHCSEQALLACFCRWRPRIERIAERLIGEDRLETDGSIRLRPQDCRWIGLASTDSARQASTPLLN